MQERYRHADTHGSPPSRGAWIEIALVYDGDIAAALSPPSRGAWIEIPRVDTTALKKDLVAPLAGGVD